MIYLRIPTTPGKPIPQDLTRWLIWLCKNHKVDFDFSQGNTGVARNRNLIGEEFLNKSKDNDILWMLDDDVIPPMTLLRGSHKVLSGIYSHLIGGGVCYSAWWTSDNGYKPLLWIPEKPFKADAVGAGCLMLHREVLVNTPYPWFEDHFQETSSKLDLGEDFDFSEKVRKAGYDIWVEPRYLCHHYKPLSMLLMEMAVKKTLLTEGGFGDSI